MKISPKTPEEKVKWTKTLEILDRVSNSLNFLKLSENAENFIFNPHSAENSKKKLNTFMFDYETSQCSSVLVWEG